MQRCYRVLGHSLGILTILATLATTLGVTAQQVVSPAPLQVTSRLVVLDVEVTDNAGKPITDLHRDDLQVFEDDKLQSLHSFEAPSAHTLPAESAAVGTVFDPAHPASFGQSAVTILVLDQINTHFADSSFARRQLHDYLAGQPALLPQPATLLALHEGHFDAIQGFTRDRDLLLRALAATPVKYAWTLELNGKTEYGPLDRLEASLNALETMAQSYAPIPGRKNIIWVGGGMPAIDPQLLDSKDARIVQADIRHVTDTLLGKRMTLYGIDPTSSAAGMNEVTDLTQMAFVQAGGDGLGISTDTFDVNADFDQLGRLTGGRIVRGRNDLAQQLATAVSFGAQFYTLSYTPTSSSEAAAKFRSIRVACRRPGVVVTTRLGYFPVASMREDSPAAISSDLGSAVESALPLRGLKVTADASPKGSAEEQQWILEVSSPGLYWSTETDGTSVAHVSVLAASFSSKGKMLEHTVQNMTAVAKPGTNLRDETVMAKFTVGLKPSPSPTRLRFIVRDAQNGNTGSADVKTARP